MSAVTAAAAARAAAAMDRYDRLRAHGVSDVDAMTRVAPFFDQPPARTGDPGPARASVAADTRDLAQDAALVPFTARGAAAAAEEIPAHAHASADTGAGQRAGPDPAAAAQADVLTRHGAEHAGLYQRDTAAVVDQRTRRVDEHADAGAGGLGRVVRAHPEPGPPRGLPPAGVTSTGATAADTARPPTAAELSAPQLAATDFPIALRDAEPQHAPAAGGGTARTR